MDSTIKNKKIEEEMEEGELPLDDEGGIEFSGGGSVTTILNSNTGLDKENFTAAAVVQTVKFIMSPTDMKLADLIQNRTYHEEMPATKTNPAIVTVAPSRKKSLEAPDQDGKGDAQDAVAVPCKKLRESDDETLVPVPIVNEELSACIDEEIEGNLMIVEAPSPDPALSEQNPSSEEKAAPESDSDCESKADAKETEQQVESIPAAGTSQIKIEGTANVKVEISSGPGPCKKNANVTVVDLASDSEDDVQIVTNDKENEEAAGKNTSDKTKSPVRLEFLAFSSQAEVEVVGANDVKLKPLPFYEHLDTIVPLTRMDVPPIAKCIDVNMYSYTLRFSLSKKNCDMISKDDHESEDEEKDDNDNKNAEVHLRFCVMKKKKVPGTKSEEQDDCLPPEVELTINKVPCWPDYYSSTASNHNDSSKNENRSIDITKFIHWSPNKENEIIINWDQLPVENVPYNYGVSAILLKPMTVDSLLKNIKTLSGEDTLRKIKIITNAKDAEDEKKNDDADVDFSAPIFINVSLLCPIGMKKILHPGCGVRCKHVQCFDLKTFLDMLFSNFKNNGKITSVKCPVCADKMAIEDLRSDVFFGNVLEKLKEQNVTNLEVKIFPDGKVVVGGNDV